MKKSIYIILSLSLCLVLLTGCKRSEPAVESPAENTQEQVVQGDVVLPNQATLPEGVTNFGDLASGVKIEVPDEGSFVNTDFSYLDITDVNVAVWNDYFNETYSMAFSHPTDYAVFEDFDGDIIVTGEGVGDLMVVLVDQEGVDLDNVARSNTILLNGQEFIIREVPSEDGVGGEISYYTSKNGRTFRFFFTFNEEDSYIDLFNRIMQTVTFFE